MNSYIFMAKNLSIVYHNHSSFWPRLHFLLPVNVPIKRLAKDIRGEEIWVESF